MATKIYISKPALVTIFMLVIFMAGYIFFHRSLTFNLSCVRVKHVAYQGQLNYYQNAGGEGIICD